MKTESNKIQFSYTDAWIAYSLYLPNDPGKLIKLKEIISFGDYIDHSIPNYEEVVDSIQKLMSIGLAIQVNNEFKTTDHFNDLWKKHNNKIKASIGKEMSALKLFLDANFADATKGEKLKLTEQDYRQAVDAYLRK